MKKTLAKGLLGLVVVAFSMVPSFAVDWISIGPGHFIDAHSIRPTSNYGAYTYNTKYVALDNRPLEVMNGKAVYTINTTSYVDCSMNYARSLSYSAFDNNGKVVSSGKNVGKQWYNINNPGSRAFESYAFVCTDKYLQVRPAYNNFWWY